MKLVTLFVLFFLVIIQAQPRDNAAVIYWKAAAVMHELPKNKSDKLKKIIQREIKIDNEFKNILKYNKSSIQEVLKGSKVKYCRFTLPIEYKEGFRLLLPHLSKCLELSRILLLDAARYAQEGKWKKAMRRFQCCFQFANHVQQDSFLISGLVSQAIIKMTMKAMLKNIEDPKCPLESVIEIKKCLDSEAYLKDMITRCMTSEKLLLKPYKIKARAKDLKHAWP